MFGPPMRIEVDGFGVILRPPTRKEMEALAPDFSSMNVHMYTMRTFAVTSENEGEWYDRVSKNHDSCQWAIVPDGSNEIVGITGLNRMDPIAMSCMSGIIIARQEWWGKGVASRAHLARTYYAARFLNRHTIQSMVRTPNTASYKALLKMGYMITGCYKANWFRNGMFMDSYILSWLNPETLVLTRPDGPQDEEEAQAIKRAKEALDLAKEAVSFL